MTTQIAVKLPDPLVERVDALVNAGSFASRSEAVRRALEALVEDSTRAAIDRAFREGYERFPVTDEELADAYRLGIESIEEEPWEKWW